MVNVVQVVDLAGRKIAIADIHLPIIKCAVNVTTDNIVHYQLLTVFLKIHVGVPEST